MNIKNEHERDKNISFNPEGHTYIIGDGSIPYLSATRFVKTLFPAFNPDYIISKMKKSSNWNKEHKHFNKTDAEIKNEWNLMGQIASSQGTNLHESIHNYLNDSLTEEPEIKEWSMFKDYINSFTLEPYRSEWMIYDEKNLICGTLDFIAKNPDGTYTIIDWKRSKHINEPSSLFMANTSYWHYTLQLNIYKYILEQNYNIKVSKLLIVQIHPDNDSVKIYNILNKQSEISKYLRNRRIQLKIT